MLTVITTAANEWLRHHDARLGACLLPCILAGPGAIVLVTGAYGTRRMLFAQGIFSSQENPSGA